MTKFSRYALAIALFALSPLGHSAMADDRPPLNGETGHMPSEDGRKQIQEVLDNYAKSVTTGDRALFESQLLDEKIPFFGLGEKLSPSFEPNLQSLQGYAGFRKAVFESGKKYSQKISNIDIKQDGDLAQVSLDFETTLVESGKGVHGWKILQLLKVRGHWKIASELYTVR
ncbi:nuclear transport factor 2 family protein [Collimonas fungivorans]|uniref:nuclear transport factor 2 family protein n=1 Tax=Collimonas fungivorans TaxID=158899 RepID=UPI003FA3D1EA